MAFKALILAGTALLAVGAQPAYATMAVIDVKNIAESQKQLSALREQIGTLEDQLNTAKENLSVVTDQLDVLRETKTTIDSTLSSIGEVGNISIPSLNFTTLAGNVASDMSCLVPDYKSLMPSIKMENVSFGSICERGSAYKSGLVVTPDSLREAETWDETITIQEKISDNRIATISDATFKGLAQSDAAHETAAKTLETAQEYKAAGKSAETVQARLQVLIELEVAQLATQAQTNQLLSQILKLHASQTLASHVPLESELAEDREYNNEGGANE